MRGRGEKQQLTCGNVVKQICDWGNEQKRRRLQIPEARRGEESYFEISVMDDVFHTESGLNLRLCIDLVAQTDNTYRSIFAQIQIDNQSRIRMSS